MEWNKTVASECRYGEIAGEIWGDWDVIWEDSEADYQGHATILAKKGNRYSFYEWWLAMEDRDLYCPHCNPDGVTVFEGVTKEAADKLRERIRELEEQNRRLVEAAHTLAMLVLQSDFYSNGKPDYVEAVDNVLCYTARRHLGKEG